jgi:4-alpha-glucanotransferase
MGLEPPARAHQALRRRLSQEVGLMPDASIGEVVAGTYRLLGTAPCALLAATLEDALEVVERPNYPGTTGEGFSWSLALPLSLEELERDERARRIARALTRS